MDYLPNNATIDEACEWLQYRTGQKWTLPRLLEDGHLTPYVWLDCEAGYPQISGSYREGHLTKMVYHGDVMRLAADRNEALLTMFTTHDGTLVRPDPAWRVELKDVRFKREHIERVAEIINGAKTAPAQTPAPEQAAKPDITLMATRKQLIDAFGAFTGMEIQWFNTIKDTPALLAARKVTGQGGRGHIAEPMFCPFEVLQWLTDTDRRKGRPLGQSKGWELFEGHFPRAYAAFSVGDPRTD